MAIRPNADLPPRLLRTKEAARFLGFAFVELERAELIEERGAPDSVVGIEGPERGLELCDASLRGVEALLRV